MRDRDPLGYYAVLNVSPDASGVEIRLAYEFLKQSYRSERKQLDIARIRAAYQTLSHPRDRKAYDTGRAANSGTKLSLADVKRALGAHVLPIAVGLIVLGIVVLLSLVGPDLRASFVTFDAGDELYWVDHNRPLGTIEAFEERHAFPTGATVPAYRVKPSTGGEPEWYPARDLERHARRR